MLGINFNSNFLIIIIVSYGLYFIIYNNFKKKENQENLENIEGFEEPSSFDLYDKKYKPILKNKNDDLCINTKKVSNDCLPYSINYQPTGNKQFEEPNSTSDNLLGQNFLNAKHHSQVDHVGTYARNKKVDIRPELINPQLGVDPWTQSNINIDWKKDDKVLQNPDLNKNVFDRF
jgi:hypothetical protein